MALADDQKKFDLWHAGVPLVQLGTDSDDAIGFDIWHAGTPIALAGTGFGSVDATVSTSQAQAAAATASVYYDLTVACAQAQGTTAAGAVQNPQDGVTTQQLQLTQAQASVGIDATAATAQAQRAAGSGVVSVAASATTGQAQSAQAAVSVVTPWAVLHNEFISTSGAQSASSVSMTPMSMSGGNHILVAVRFASADAVNTTVTDSNGNVFTATEPATHLYGSTYYLQWFYCLNAKGGNNNIVTVSWDIPVWMPDVAMLRVSSPAGGQFDVATAKTAGDGFTASSSITSDPFNTGGAGVIVAAQYSFAQDAEGFTFESGYTPLPDSRLFFEAGYRITTGALTGEQVTFNGSAGYTTRMLATLAIKGAATVTTDATTAQAQSATATLAAIDHAVSASTAQAQATAASANVAITAQVATQQSQTTSAGTAQAIDTTAASAQAQSTAAVALLAVAAAAMTAQAEQAGGTLAAEHRLAAASAQAQAVQGTLALAADAATTTLQGQTAAAEAGLAAAFDATTAQGQAVDAVIDAVTLAQAQSAQVQTAAAEAGLSVDTTVDTRQWQRLRATGNGVLAFEVDTAQAQSVGNSTFLTVGVAAVVTTAQAAQATAAMLDQYTPTLATLSARLSLRCAAGGTADIALPVLATIQNKGAVHGRIDARPA